jgi:hypothetical protein
MAKNKNSFLGGLSGTVGNLVGYQSNGTQMMRRRPEFKKNRQLSEAQILVQAKFKMASDFFRKIEELLSITYTTYKENSLRTAAMGNLVPSIEGDIDNLSINYQQVLVATGKLVAAKGQSVSSTQPGILDFEWRSVDVSGSTASDKAILVAWCEETDELWYTVAGPQRSTLAGQLQVPFFSGKQVQTWISFISADGTNAARSVYAGAVLVA